MKSCPLSRQTFRYLENFSSTVPSVNTAVALTKLLVAVCELEEIEGLAAKIGKRYGKSLKVFCYGFQ